MNDTLHSVTLVGMNTPAFLTTAPASWHTPHDAIASLLPDLLAAPNGVVAVLKAYLDRSARPDKADGIMGVAACLFEPTAYERFSQEWGLMVRKWGAPAFHATDFYGGYRKFTRDTAERQRWFEEDKTLIGRLFDRDLLQVIVASFKEQEFLRLISKQWRAGGVFCHAIWACAHLIGQWCDQHGYLGEIEYFLERGSGDEREGPLAFYLIQENPVAKRDTRLSSYSIIEKGRAIGMEAADCFAWHCTKDLAEIAEGCSPTPDHLDAIIQNNPERYWVQALEGDHLRQYIDLFEQSAITGEVDPPTPGE